MRGTPYSPFVEKETAPVLWYVRVASLVLRFSGIVRQVCVRPDRVEFPALDRPGVALGGRRPSCEGGNLRMPSQPSVGFNQTFGLAGPRWLALASAATCDGRSDSGGYRHSGSAQFRPKPSDMSIGSRQGVSTWDAMAARNQTRGRK